jgi:hypothetical protein
MLGIGFASGAGASAGDGGAAPLIASILRFAFALGELVIELLDEIEVRFDGVDIDEELTAREGLGEVIVEPPRGARGVVSPVVDEDPGHALYPRG